MADKATNQIVFEWEGKHFTVPERKSPIVLPNGEVIHSETWRKDPNASDPGELVKEYTLNVDVGGEDMMLDRIAEDMNGIFATEVTIKNVNVCPNGCKRPTSPHCRKCGSKVESSKVITPVKD